jgi:hypothetical protein
MNRFTPRDIARLRSSLAAPAIISPERHIRRGHNGGPLLHSEDMSLQMLQGRFGLGFLSAASAGPTLNPLDKSSFIALSNANLTFSNLNASWRSVRGTLSHVTGVYSYSVLIGSMTTDVVVGLGRATSNLESYAGAEVSSVGYFASGGYIFNNASIIFNVATSTTGDTITVTFDDVQSKAFFYKNGTLLNSIFVSGSSNGAYFPMVSALGNGSTASSGTASFAAWA